MTFIFVTVGVVIIVFPDATTGFPQSCWGSVVGPESISCQHRLPAIQCLKPGLVNPAGRGSLVQTGAVTAGDPPGYYCS